MAKQHIMTPAKVDKLSRLLKEASQHFDAGLWFTTKQDIEYLNGEFQSIYPTLK